jgi:hypothetical protein
MGPKQPVPKAELRSAWRTGARTGAAEEPDECGRRVRPGNLAAGVPYTEADFLAIDNPGRELASAPLSSAAGTTVRWGRIGRRPDLPRSAPGGGSAPTRSPNARAVFARPPSLLADRPDELRPARRAADPDSNSGARGRVN